MGVQAYILIHTDVGKAADVAAEIRNVPGVTPAEAVPGPYDVIGRAEANDVEELGRLVVAQVQNLPGIARTLTGPVVHIGGDRPAAPDRTRPRGGPGLVPGAASVRPADRREDLRPCRAPPAP